MAWKIETAEDWNKRYPVGTLVEYWSGELKGSPRRARTRTKAWDVCGTPVVGVSGVAGGIALSHIMVVHEP